MAWVEFKVGENRHVTLMHFSKLTDSQAASVVSLLITIGREVDSLPKPTAVITNLALFGFKNNILVCEIEDDKETLVSCVRHLLEDIMQRTRIPYSKDFSFNPHITDPDPSWGPGTEVSLAPELVFHFKLGGCKRVLSVPIKCGVT